MTTPFSHSPTDVIRKALIAAGAGTDPAAAQPWPVYADNEPSSPDNVVTLFETAGISDGRTMVDGEAQVHLGVQARVRGRTGDVGRVRADLIRSKFESVYSMVVVLANPTASYYLHCFARIQPVIPLGDESPDSKRKIFTVDATVALTPL